MIEKGITRMGRPVADVQAAIENTGNIEVAKLENGLSIMATISSGAPMLGFLGYGNWYGTCLLEYGQCRK